MKNYTKELTILLIQTLLFYAYPMLNNGEDPIGMVISIIIVTFLLSTILNVISTQKITKYYPIVIAILFIPTVFIYYNESALIHSLWYLVIASLGAIIGMGIRKIITITKETKKR